MTVKGAPDVVLDRCSHALWHGEQVPIDEVRDELAGRQPAAVREGAARCSRSRPATSTTPTMAAALADPMARGHTT